MIGLKKNLNFSRDDKRQLIQSDKSSLTVSKKCELLGLSRGTFYYEAAQETELNLELMNWIDEQYLKTPFYGSRRMAALLKHQGFKVNRKRIQNLMRHMGIEAIYPKRNLSQKKRQHKIYPYLLEKITIDQPNLVWSADITYIRIKRGFLYLMAIIDWFSRFVLSWRLSNTLANDFCIEATQEALERYQKKPQIFNVDQGAQFTAKNFVEVIEKAGVKISMDGRGRALDNVFIERLWRSLKYEEVYLKSYESVKEAYEGIRNYFDLYNHRRPHQALKYQFPYVVHYGNE